MIMFYKISDVAEMLNLNWNTVYLWCRNGKLPAVHFNRTYRIPVKALKKFLKEREIKVEKPVTID